MDLASLLLAAGGGSFALLAFKVATWLHNYRREQAEDRWRSVVLRELRRRHRGH